MVLQYAADASIDGCVTFMETKDLVLLSRAANPTWYPRIRCMHFGECSFSLAIAKHTNSGNPCTNTLVFCPACPTEPVPTVHYTYAGGDASNPKGILHHWSTKHSGLEMPAELRKSITAEEHANVLKIGKGPPKKRTHNCVAPTPGSTRADAAVPGDESDTPGSALADAAEDASDTPVGIGVLDMSDSEAGARADT